jgi:hypothetical protein
MRLKFRKYIPSWEWFFLLGTVVVLALFVLGKDWFGLNGLLSSVFALGGAVATTIIAFIMAALIGPLLALITGLVASMIMPVLVLGSSLFTTIIGWLATTWIGALFSPAYALVAPIMLKLSPLLTMSKYGHKAYDWLDDQSWWPEKLVFTTNKRLLKAKSVKKAAGKRRK